MPGYYLELKKALFDGKTVLKPNIRGFRYLGAINRSREQPLSFRFKQSKIFGLFIANN
jgi:hypothetical protein